MDMQKIKEFKDKLNANMAKVERCNVLAEKCRSAKIGFIDQESNRGIELDSVLTEGQIQTISNMAIIAIESNADDAREWLEQIVNFNPEEKKKSFADGSDDEEPVENKDESKEDNKENNKNGVTLDKKAVKELLDSGMTQKAIAEKFGVSPKTISVFISKNNLKKDEKKNSPSKK